MKSNPSSPSRRQLSTVVMGTALLAVPALSALASEVTLPPVSVGAGVRTSYTHFDPDSGDSTDDFELNSARIYLSGKATENIGIHVQHRVQRCDESVHVIDAVAQFSFSDQFNIWAGRFLPPSDRANLYGPYYSNEWGVYTDGIQDGYPFETTAATMALCIGANSESRNFVRRVRCARPDERRFGNVVRRPRTTRLLGPGRRVIT